MKCIYCGSENINRCTVNVDGKLYGIIAKDEKKNKFKISGFICDDCGCITLKKAESK